MSGEIKQRSVPLHIIPVSPRATRPPLLFNVFLRSRPAEIKLWDVLSWQRRTRCRQGSRGPHVKLSVAYIIDRVYYVCKTGCQWSTLDVEGGSYKTIFHYFNLWSKARLFEHAFYALSSSKPFITGPLSIDTSFVKNVFGRDVIGRNPTDRGRKATKVSLLVNSRGTPLCCVYHQGNKSDIQSLGHMLTEADRRGIPLRRYAALLADKGYDSATCRAQSRQHGLEPLIPHRRTLESYPGRYVVEQTFGLLDQFRRIRSRYEALVRNFKSMHHIACSAIITRR